MAIPDVQPLIDALATLAYLAGGVLVLIPVLDVVKDWVQNSRGVKSSA